MTDFNLSDFFLYMSDPSFMLIAIIALLLFGVVAMYMMCCYCAMRGELDLDLHPDSHRPYNRLFLINPFKKRKPVSNLPV